VEVAGGQLRGAHDCGVPGRVLISGCAPRNQLTASGPKLDLLASLWSSWPALSRRLHRLEEKRRASLGRDGRPARPGCPQSRAWSAGGAMLPRGTACRTRGCARAGRPARTHARRALDTWRAGREQTNPHAGRVGAPESPQHARTLCARRGQSLAGGAPFLKRHKRPGRSCKPARQFCSFFSLSWACEGLKIVQLAPSLTICLGRAVGAASC